jgi:hypothetical protein
MDRSQSASPETVEAPYPGSKAMPRWNVGKLPDAPRFTWKNWASMLGPGLLAGGAAIGGGEWLMGPAVTARFGGNLLWLATLSIVGQVIYNIEISRYTLYTGEPIFTGKFRTLPGPQFWVVVYLLLDFGSVFPYLAANAATPLAAVFLGQIPDPKDGYAALHLFGFTAMMTHQQMIRWLSYAIFLGSLVPLIFGGKIYNALKAIMSFKIITVMGFLIVLAIFQSHWKTWAEISSGFLKFGNVPIRTVEDRNHNGKLDPGEDWDGDGKLDVMEPSLALVFDTDGDGKPDATDINNTGKPDPMVNIGTAENPIWWPDLNRDGKPDDFVPVDTDGDGKPDGMYPVDANHDGKLDAFIDIDGDGIRDGDNVENVFVSLWRNGKLPHVDWGMIAFLSALVAISGNGGLSNTPISNYTRDQGWGMGSHVGAIPSVFGGQNIQLSHVGTVFLVSDESLPRWKRWYRHVFRDQAAVWMPACFFGLALPSMLSVEFLKRGQSMSSGWVAAGFTAGAVRDRVAESMGSQAWGHAVWYMTLFCGFLVLAPTMAASADGIVRRWVDVFWTASKTLRAMDPGQIRYVYFGTLAVLSVFGMVMLSMNEPTRLLLLAGMIYNFALAFSCFHTVFVNTLLLPKELRPGWITRTLLVGFGTFFLAVGTMATLHDVGLI